MAEFTIYDESKRLYEEIRSGKRTDYVLTSEIPFGIRVSLGPPSADSRNFLRRMVSERDYGPVVCIGPMSNARYLLAVNPGGVRQADGRLK